MKRGRGRRGEMTGVAILVGDDYWVMIVSSQATVLWQYVSTTLGSASSNYGDSWERGQIIVNFYYIYNLSSFPACTADQEE